MIRRAETREDLAACTAIHNAAVRIAILGMVTVGVITAVLFYAAVTPTALLFRILGKDPLRLSRDPEARSYWIDRQPPGPAPETMTNQF